MFALIPEPLLYAQQFCAQYARLAQACDSQTVATELVAGAARLSGCDLAQLHLVDGVHGRLVLASQCLDGVLQQSQPADVQAGHDDETLLGFCLSRNQVVSIAEIEHGIYDTGFLPVREPGWRSLICLPLADREDRVQGLLLCATRRIQALEMFVASLRLLGTSAIAHIDLLQRVLAARAPGNEALAGASRRAKSRATDYGLIGESAAIQHIRRLIEKALHTQHTVLLTGETGTGKEVVSRAIHDHGPRRDKPFVVQNCAAFPDSLLESELFGYRKGAFTGADRDRAGLFETAHGGTLMLDEIGDMPLALQAKLLRVLQEGEIRPLGSSVTRKVNVRIIAATHRDLKGLIADGRFRADLYYRLAQFPVALPPLRQRDGDAVALARHFADEACQILKRSVLHWSDAALALLAGHDFPGNVRELKGMVERAVLMCESDELCAQDFLIAHQAPVTSEPLKLREQLDAYERDILLQCLRNSGGNRSLTARKLGLARRTLLYRMAHLQIDACTSRASG
jgi:sigma-54-dependent transcriptional regulator